MPDNPQDLSKKPDITTIPGEQVFTPPNFSTEQDAPPPPIVKKEEITTRATDPITEEKEGPSGGAAPSFFDQPTTPGLNNLPPIVNLPKPPARKLFPTKTVATILGLLVIIGGVAGGATLVQQRQELREKAAGQPCSQGCGTNEYCNASGVCATKIGSGEDVGGCCDQSAASDSPNGCRSWETCSIPNGSCQSGFSCNAQGGGGGGGGCTPIVDFSGASTSGFDCRNQSSVSISIIARRPAGCDINQELRVDYKKTNANCPGDSYAGCQGACGTGANPATLVIPAGQNEASESVSCSAPACGSCQVDLEEGGRSYGVRVWQNTGCGGPTPTPTATPPGVTPTPTPTSTPPGVTPTPTPGLSASCLNIKAYDTNWNQLTAGQLAQLRPGARVRFTVSGFATSGTFDKAKFKINGVESETTSKKPSSSEFYYEYLIPTGTLTFTIEAQVHHLERNQWY